MRCFDCRHYNAETNICDINDDQIHDPDSEISGCAHLYTNRDMLNMASNESVINEIMKLLDSGDYCQEYCPAKEHCSVDCYTGDWRIPCRSAWGKWLDSAAESEWKKDE